MLIANRRACPGPAGERLSGLRVDPSDASSDAFLDPFLRAVTMHPLKRRLGNHVAGCGFSPEPADQLRGEASGDCPLGQVGVGLLEELVDQSPERAGLLLHFLPPWTSVSGCSARSS